MQSTRIKKQLRECNSLPKKLCQRTALSLTIFREYVTSTNKSLAAVPERAAGTKCWPQYICLFTIHEILTDWSTRQRIHIHYCSLQEPFRNLQNQCNSVNKMNLHQYDYKYDNRKVVIFANQKMWRSVILTWWSNFIQENNVITISIISITLFEFVKLLWFRFQN